jgi:hypothetical protein
MLGLDKLLNSQDTIASIKYNKEYMKTEEKLKQVEQENALALQGIVTQYKKFDAFLNAIA